MVCSVVEGSGFVTVGVRRDGVVGRVGVRGVVVRLEELVVDVVGVRLGILDAAGVVLLVELVVVVVPNPEPVDEVPSGMPMPPVPPPMPPESGYTL